MQQTIRIWPVIVDSIVKRYGKKVVLDDVSLSVDSREIFGLLGPNGAGKSTLLESIAGLRAVDGGTVRVFGADPTKDRAAITPYMSVQPQAASLFETLTVAETLRLYASFHSSPDDVGALIGRLGLREQRDTRAGNLSGGQMRRLLIGTALIGRPKLVVLDEPSAGLDPQAKRSLHDLIKSTRDRGITVLLSTHDMQEATELCDRVGILAGGRLRAVGTPDELMRDRIGGATVSFVIDEAVDLASLRHYLGTSEVSVDVTGSGTRVVVRTSDPDDVVRKLTFSPTLRARGFHVQLRTLEDVYLELTGDGTIHALDGHSAGGRA